MITITIAVIAMGRGSHLVLYVTMDHGAHRLIQTLMLVVMRLLRLSAVEFGPSRGHSRASNSIGLLQMYVVPEAGRPLTAYTSQDHPLARRGWQLGRSTSISRVVMAIVIR